MRITFSRLAVIALTLWLGFATGAVNAGVPTISAWEGSANAGYNAIFGNTGVGSVSNEWISFSMPSDSSGNGESNVIRLGGGGISFSTLNLYENAILIATGILDGSNSFLNFSAGSTPGKYSLSIAGFKLNPGVSASYGGNISINPVPEPETYAMLLAGLGMIGFSIRRRKSETFD